MGQDGSDDSLELGVDGAEDFTDQAIKDGAATRVGERYDRRRQEDNARRRIAYMLIGLLGVLVIGMLLLLAFGSIQVADIKDFGVVLGPLIALVSAATGFYYGTKSNPPTDE